jgi:hypothetical protein
MSWTSRLATLVALSAVLPSSCTLPDFAFDTTSCDDGRKNGEETGVDCGGQCEACPVDAECTTDDECAPGTCIAGACEEPSCTDRRKNGVESDVDCGGGECSRCDIGLDCNEPGDCFIDMCNSDRCQAAHCTDGELAEPETDLDCGGGECPRCDVNDACIIDDDCTSRLCDDDRCVAPSCGDERVNGVESDIDCGGDCGPCPDGKTCGKDEDCASDACADGTCAPGGAGGTTGAAGSDGTGELGAGGSETAAGGATGAGSSGGMNGDAGDTGETGTPASLELAKGRAALADTEQASHPASHGNDGDVETRWCPSNGSAGHWWRVDLGAVRELTGVTITFEFAERLYGYRIDVSDDDASWTTVLDLADNPKLTQVQSEPLSTRGRYVRFWALALQATPTTWSCFWELELFGY